MTHSSHVTRALIYPTDKFHRFAWPFTGKGSLLCQNFFANGPVDRDILSIGSVQRLQPRELATRLHKRRVCGGCFLLWLYLNCSSVKRRAHRKYLVIRIEFILQLLLLQQQRKSRQDETQLQRAEPQASQWPISGQTAPYLFLPLSFNTASAPSRVT